MRKISMLTLLIVVAFSGVCQSTTSLNSNQSKEKQKIKIDSVTSAECILNDKKSTAEEVKLAISFLKTKAELGESEAAYWYAWMRYYGKGNIPKSLSDAFNFFSIAAAEKHPLAMYWVGYFYGKGLYVNKDKKIAKEYIKKAADTGNVELIGRYAEECYVGKLFKRDYAEAYKYALLAAKKNNTKGKYYLARCFRYGRGIPKDYKKAYSLFLELAQKGHRDAQYETAMMSFFRKGTKRDVDLEYKYFFQAASKGHIKAMYRVGNCYYFGFGTAQDYTKALQWLHKAEKKGNADAMVSIGYCYRRGFGVVKNLKESVKWYKKAASKKNDGAYLQLARAYFSGLGVERDYQKSLDYYTAIEKIRKMTFWICAAELAVFYDKGILVKQNDKKAFYYYNIARSCHGCIMAGKFLYEGRGVAEDPEAAFVKFKNSVQFGNSPLGAYWLGICYLNGKGTPKDELKAYQFLKKSALAGYGPAMKELSKLYKNGTGCEVDINKSKKLEMLCEKYKDIPDENFIGSSHK